MNLWIARIRINLRGIEMFIEQYFQALMKQNGMEVLSSESSMESKEPNSYRFKMSADIWKMLKI